jgi:hypothetical protein
LSHALQISFYLVRNRFFPVILNDEKMAILGIKALEGFIPLVKGMKYLGKASIVECALFRTQRENTIIDTHEPDMLGPTKNLLSLAKMSWKPRYLRG